MNERLKVLYDKAMDAAVDQYGLQRKGEKAWNPYVFEQLFSELIINECCFALLMLDAKAHGKHSYKQAAIEIKQLFEVQS